MRQWVKNHMWNRNDLSFRSTNCLLFRCIWVHFQFLVVFVFVISSLFFCPLHCLLLHLRLLITPLVSSSFLFNHKKFMLVYAVCISVNVILYLFKVRKYKNYNKTTCTSAATLLILNHLPLNSLQVILMVS